MATARIEILQAAVMLARVRDPVAWLHSTCLACACMLCRLAGATSHWRQHACQPSCALADMRLHLWTSPLPGRQLPGSISSVANNGVPENVTDAAVTLAV